MRAAPQAAAAQPAARSFAPFLLAAFAGGAIAAIAIIILALAGFFSSSEESRAQAEQIAVLEREIASLRQSAQDPSPLDQRLAALETSVGELSSRPATPVDDGTALKSLSDRMSALESAGVASGTGSDLTPRLDQLAGEIAALKNAAPVDTTAIESSINDLRQRLDALAARLDAAPKEEQVASLAAKLDETSARTEAASALAPVVAADALATALDSGRPFQNELAALRRLGIEASLVDALAPQAETGLPTIADLRAQFETAIEPIALASSIPEETGTIDRLLQSARGLVDVRSAHPTAGDDPAAIVARIRAALSAGDLKTALAEWNTLPDEIKTPTKAWADAAEARLRADQAVAEITASALTWLGAKR